MSKSLELAIGPVSGFRNRIINGNFLINQRGLTSSTSPGHFVDRFRLAGGLTNTTIGYSDDHTLSKVCSRHLFLRTSTVKSSLASADISGLGYEVEGLDIADFKLGRADAKAFTLQFRAVASVASTVMSVVFRNNTGDRNYIATVTLGTTPALHTITVPGDTGGTWTSDNTAGLRILFVFAAGTGLQTSGTNTWTTTASNPPLAANTQSNCLDTLNRSISIADVQLEIGVIANPFERRPYGLELMMCQRYYEVMQVTRFAFATGANQEDRTSFSWKVSKRTAPSISAPTGGATTNLTTNDTVAVYANDTFAVRMVAAAAGNFSYDTRTITGSAEL